MLSKLSVAAALGADARLFRQFMGRGEPDRSIFGPPAETTTTSVPPLTYGEDLDEAKVEYRRFSEAGMKHQDGYLPVGCVNDGMLDFGDLHGNKQSFEHPISVVRYDKVLPKNDQEAMTPEVCFKFCRNFEHAKFFGIRNGADCYCAPYFEVVAGADEDCKIACPGDSSKFCGAQQKSSVFSMHASALSQDFLAPEVIDEDKSLISHLEQQARYSVDVPMAILKAGQKLSTTQGSKGNMLATKHHETMEASHKDYVTKVDNLPNAFNKVQAANEAVLAYESEIDGATPVRAEELVKNVRESMVPVGENEHPYEKLVHKIRKKGSSVKSEGCFNGYLEYLGHSEDYTKESCSEYCGGKGYAFYGLADGGFCDCGHGIDSLELTDSMEGCSKPCHGEPTQGCGNGGHTLVFGAIVGGGEPSGKLELYQESKANVTTMCDGEVMQPVLEVSNEDDCAARCQETISPAKCVGFQYYSGLMEGGSVCMMFSDITSLVHYSGEACPKGDMGAKCMVQKTETLIQRRLEESADSQAIEGCFN